MRARFHRLAHLIIWKVCRPLLACGAVGVIFQIQICVISAAAAKQVYMSRPGIVERQVIDCFAEEIMPEQSVQITVAQVVGLAEKDAQPRQPFYYPPQFGCRLTLVH